MSFYNRLVLLCTQNNISLSHLAKVLTFSSGQLSIWKKGDIRPSLDALIKLANYFDVSIDWLVGLSNEQLIKKIPASEDTGIDSDVLEVMERLEQSGITAEKLGQLSDEQFIKLGAYLQGLLDNSHKK